MASIVLSYDLGTDSSGAREAFDGYLQARGWRDERKSILRYERLPDTTLINVTSPSEATSHLKGAEAAGRAVDRNFRVRKHFMASYSIISSSTDDDREVPPAERTFANLRR